MKKINLIILILAAAISSCSGEKTNSLTEESIDKIVESILDSTTVYDINQSLNFSNDTEQYSVVEYSINDSALLYVESFSDIDREYTRQLYMNDGSVIFIKELGFRFNDNNIDEEYEQIIYLFDDNNQKAYDKILLEEDTEFTEIDISITKEDYDFQKPINAINQKGDFELKFGEFLTVEPQTYLILDNKESNYTIALYILEGDFLLDELYSYPEKYKGKTIFANHETANMGGVTRMIYKGGILIEN